MLEREIVADHTNYADNLAPENFVWIPLQGNCESDRLGTQAHTHMYICIYI